MADQTFLIAAAATGNDPDDWSLVSTLLSGVSGGVSIRTLEWQFEPFVSYAKLANGQTRGLGLPVARWTFKGLRPEQRENIRDFCSAPSASVYIRTPTNETAAGVRTYKDYSAIMSWMERSELSYDGIEYIEMTEIVFTNLVEVVA